MNIELPSFSFVKEWVSNNNCQLVGTLLLGNSLMHSISTLNEVLISDTYQVSVKEPLLKVYIIETLMGN